MIWVYPLHTVTAFTKRWRISFNNKYCIPLVLSIVFAVLNFIILSQNAYATSYTLSDNSSDSTTNSVISIPPLPPYESVILTTENNATSLAIEGNTLARFTAYQPSYYYCDKALKLNPSNSEAQRCKNDAYKTILPLISQLSQANDNLSKDPNNQTALFSKAYALIILGEFNELSSEEKSLLDKSITLQTTNFNDLEQQFHYLIALGDYEKAKAATDKLIGEFTGQEPEESEYLGWKALTLYKEGRYDDALVLVDQAQQSNPSVNTNFIYDIERGIIYERMGQPDLANTYFDSVTANDPSASSNGKLDSLKGSYCMNFLLDYSTALNYFNNVSPNSPVYYDTAILKIVAKDRLTQISSTTNTSPQIPIWIKNNAKWWSTGSISDGDFVKGIQYMIQQGIMKIPTIQPSTHASQIPSWVKNTAGWWYSGKITDDEFVRAMQYMVQIGIIQLKS